jgi:flagellar hook-basal body complex protein FliE
VTDPIGAASRRMSEIGQAMARVRPSAEPAGAPLAVALTRALGETAAAQETAADLVTRFLRGDPVELHRVMAAVDQAGLALERLIEIRNALAEAYRAVIDT